MPPLTKTYNINDLFALIPSLESRFPLSPLQKNQFTDGSAPETFSDGAVGGDLQSTDFVAGSAGWKIEADGDVEFSDGTFRGTITATTGTIGGFTIGSTTLTATNLTLTSGAANTANIVVGTGANAGGLNSPNAASDIAIWAGSTFANRATAPFRVEADGSVTATDATITGSITSTTGTIGGFSIGSDYVRDAADSMGMASTVSGSDDVRFWAGDTFANRATADFRVTEAGAVTASSLTMTGGSISGIVNSTATDISLLEATHNLVFSVTDADTIAWATGTINLSNGRTFTIDAGNTGNMAALTYIYLDTGVSSTVLQTTTTYSTAMGANKLLIGVAQNQTTTASYIPFTGGGKPLLDGEQLGALSIGSAVIGNLAVTNAKINDMAVSKLTAGTITSKAITLAVSDTTGDVKLQAGKTDFGDDTAGFILGMDDSDSNNPKFEIGEASQYMKYDPTNGLRIAGNAYVSKAYTSGEALTANDAVYITSNSHALDLEAGSTQYASYSATDMGITGGAITLECWIRIESEPSASNYTIMTKQEATDDVAYTIYYEDVAGTKTLNFTRERIGGATITASYTVTIGTGAYHHVALTYDATDLRGYYDGALVAGPSAASGTGTGAVNMFRIGANNGAGNLFDGLIDDVRVWNTALSTATILARYNTPAELAGNETNLIAYYKLNNVYTDYTTNAYNLTATGSPVFSTTTAFSSTRVFKTDADLTYHYESFAGFALSTVASGASVQVVISGSLTGFSGLLAGTQYYISNTAGALSAAAGTNTRKAGIALSATEVLLTNIW